MGSHWLHASSSSGRPLPWQPLFSAHERRLVWSADLQARLVKSFAAHDLSLSLEEVDLRLQQLLVLLPELGKPPTTPSPHNTARVATLHLTAKLLHARLVKPCVADELSLSLAIELCLQRMLVLLPS